MSFIENSIRNYCVNYFNFKGRTGRAEFWTVTLILIVVSVLLNCLYPTLQTLFSLLTVIPTMAMVMRRANDSNLSKVVVVLYYVFSFMGVILILSAVAAVTMFSHGLSSTSTGVYTVTSLILISFFTIFSTIIAIILWLIIACRKTREIPSSTKDSAEHFATDFTTDSSMDSNSDSTADRYNVKR